MISKALFEQIPDDDWRKETWIAPEDAGKAPGTKYHTLFTDENFKKGTNSELSRVPSNSDKSQS